MAAPAQTKVVIAGDASGALKAINDTKAALSSAGREFSGAFTPLTAGVKGFQAAIAGLSAALAGGALFKASISSANEWNKTVGSIARAMGTTTEKASVMAVAMERLGIESDTVVKATVAMTRQLVNNEEAFQRLGVQTRDLSTGALLPAGQIMGQVNDRLSAIGNITERNVAGLSIYGRSWYEVRDVLRLTGDELKEAEKRAQSLGLIVGAEAVAATRQFKLQLNDLGLIAKSVQVRLGNELLPAFVNFGKVVSEQAPTIGKALSSVFQGAAVAGGVVVLTLKDVGDALGAAAASAAALLSGDLERFQAIREARQQEADANRRAADALIDSFGATASAESDAAERRKKLQKDLQTQLANLEFLRAVAAGKASLQITEDDEKQTKARISNAEKLNEALRSAWQKTVDEARSAGEAATALLDKAAQTRAGGKQTAEEIRRGTLDQATQDYLNQREAQDRTSQAVHTALQAKLAAGYGRTENAARLADQATKDAERAAKLIDKLIDPEDKARAIEQLVEAQANADEARAKIKQQEAAQAETQAQALQKQIESVDSQIADLEKRASQIALQVQIDQAQAAIASIRAELDALQDKTITVTINQQGGADLAQQLASFDAAAAASGYARGGYTGHGGKFQPAGIVHAGEFVIPQEVVRQRGALEFLTRLLRQGMAAIPGYADGGLVGRLALPSLRPEMPAQQRAAAVFNFPGFGGPYTTTMDNYTFERITRDFSKAALQKGGRR